MAAVGSWSGLQFNSAASVDITHARISGADIGLKFAGCPKVYLTSTAVTKCNVGLLLQGSKIVMDDCLIAFNRGSGIRDNMSEAMISRSTISNNKEWAYACEYYGTPKFESCVLVDNKLGGIQGAPYDAYAEARNCVIANNGKFDVVHQGTRDWDFSGCWWGEINTKRLIASGEDVNLRSIKDQLDDAKVARVRIHDFLREKPENVGSSLASAE